MTKNLDSVHQVVTTEMIRTSKSWDGIELSDYLDESPELVAKKYVFPFVQKLGWYHQPSCDEFRHSGTG